MELPNIFFNITILEFNEISATVTLPLVYVKAPELSEEGVSRNEISNVDFVISENIIVGLFFTNILVVIDLDV